MMSNRARHLQQRRGQLSVRPHLPPGAGDRLRAAWGSCRFAAGVAEGARSRGASPIASGRSLSGAFDLILSRPAQASRQLRATDLGRSSLALTTVGGVEDVRQADQGPLH